MVLLGHNGAGKTTLINHLLGFYTDLSQHPFLPGFQTFLEKKGVVVQDCAYAPEVASLEPELSAKDYFQMIAAIRGIKNYEMNDWLQRVALNVEGKQAIKHYSKGMRQRLMLALALMAGADTLILDEPTSGLDPYGRELVEELIVTLKATHRLIISTHSLDLAARLGEEVWILREGEIVYDGEVQSKEALVTLLKRFRPESIQ